MQPPFPEKGFQNPNDRTIEILQQMMAYYDQTADHWRTIAYRKCISALRRQPFKVSTKEQARVIPGIGERLAEKIEEIVCTDRLRRLENTNLTSEDKALQLFLGVYGVGFAQASRWIAQGYRSLEDLNTKAKLTRNQRIGLDRYDDFQSRIPREEVHMHGDLVRQAVLRVDNGMRVIIGGSYRRGAADSGDIDCLITRPGTTVEFIRTVMMDTVIPSLFREGFLKVSLAASSRHDSSKWNGASCLPGHNTWRRIDLLFVPGDEIGAAILYFTGNDIFNRSMRLLARKKGMCLNQHGLYKDVIRNRYAGKESAGTLVEARDERKIFEVLGVPWREPEQRIC
jgi:DNA polymerase IV